MNFFRNRLFLASCLGHVALDIFNSSRSVLIAFFSVPLGLTDGVVGLTIGLYQLTGSITQPVFGWLSDRYGLRWLLGGSVAWSVGFIALGALAAAKGLFVGLLVFWVLASLGSAAFHPVGTKYAALTTVTKTATATAFFFLFGQLGLAAGPILSGVALQRQGIGGVLMLALLTAPIILFVLTTPVSAAKSNPKIRPAAKTTAPSKKVNNIQWKEISILVAFTFCRSWTLIGTIAFMPKLFQGKGWEPAVYGAITGTMWLGSAISGVIAGNLADRWGRRKVIFGSMMLAVIPLYLLPVTDSSFAFVLAALVGALTGASHSIVVVIAQKMLPNMQATASGLILGLIFGMGSLSVICIGWLADLWSLEQALQVGAVMALFAALLSLALPQTRTVTEAALNTPLT